MRLPILAFATLAITGIAGASHAQTFKATYDVSLAGLPLGTADVASTFEGSRYNMQFAVKLTGIAKMLTGGKGAATAAGAIVGARPQPSHFAITSRSSSDQRIVRMGLNGGNVAAIEIDPPIEEKPDRVEVKEADKKGVVDPLSALLMPVAAGKNPTDPANCNRTLPVFDGASRFNIVLSYGKTDNTEVPGYKGAVLVCNARYVPISGHRALRPSTKFMVENKDMSVTLAPLEGQKMLVPVKISVRTMVGVSVAEVSSWSLGGDSAMTPIKAGAAQ